MEKNYEEIDLEGSEEKTNDGKDELAEIRAENKRIVTVAFSVVAVCSTIIAGTLVATVSLL